MPFIAHISTHLWLLGQKERDYILSSGKIQTFLSKGGGAHAGIWGGWVHVEPSPWFEVLLFFWLPVYFNLFNGNDVWKERFYCLLKQWKHNCKERVKEINFSYTSYYRFYAHNTQSAMAEKGHIYVRKKKHINKKKLNKQQQQKHKQSSVLFWEGESCWDTK